MSQVSTGRLILEGVVENVKIYRLHKEEEARKEREQARRRRRSMADGGHKSGRHADSGGEGRRHRHRRKHGSRDRRSRSGERRSNREIPDPVIERDPDPDPKYMMTGATGPPGTLPPIPSQQDQHTGEPQLQDVPSRTRSRSRSRPRRSSPRPRPRSPNTRRGPDGSTPFGQLPKKAAGVGLAAHIFNTYRHIKAEHDAGHRDRSVVEKAVDKWRGKTPGKDQTHHDDRSRGDDRRHDDRTRGDNRTHDDRTRKNNRTHDDRDQRHEGRKRGDGDDRERRRDGSRKRGNDGHRRRHKYYRTDDMSRKKRKDPDLDKDLPRRPPTPLPPHDLFRDISPSSRDFESPLPPQAPLHLPALRVQSPTPPVRSNHEETPWPPTPENFVVPRSHSRVYTVSRSRSRSESRPRRSRSRSRSVSPPYPDTPRGRSRSPVIPMHHAASEPPPLSPPPPPPMPVNDNMPVPNPQNLAQAAPNRGALLDQISGGGFNLRKVGGQDNGRRAAYEETSHSRDVEERERSQASNRTWSDAGSNDGDGENESERRRALKVQIAQGLAGRIGIVDPGEIDAAVGDEVLTRRNRWGTVESGGVEEVGSRGSDGKM